MKRIVGTLVNLMLLFCCVAVYAGEGRTPIWQPRAIGPGQEGHYILTRDVTAAAGAPAIDILPGTAAVDIDLNGFTIYGSDADIINAGGVDSLTVRNGTLTGGARSGIRAQDCRKVVIEDVKFQVQEARGVELLDVATFALRRNIVYATGSVGIFIDAFGGPAAEGVIEDCIIRECGEGIVLLNGLSVAFLNNRVEQTTIGDGIRANVCYGCLVADNTVQAAAAFGIVLDESRVCKLYDNVVYRSQAEGIALLQATEDCLVLNNVSSQNGLNGFITDGFRHHIDQNVFNFNGQSGLCIPGADNTFGRNTTRANGAICGPCSSNPPACVPPDVCLYGPGNSSFGDNMGPNPGC